LGQNLGIFETEGRLIKKHIFKRKQYFKNWTEPTGSTCWIDHHGCEILIGSKSYQVKELGFYTKTRKKTIKLLLENKYKHSSFIH
jgi:hypothetical protein